MFIYANENANSSSFENEKNYKLPLCYFFAKNVYLLICIYFYIYYKKYFDEDFIHFIKILKKNV